MRLLFESVPGAPGSAEAAAGVARGAEVGTAVLLVTVFMWPSLQWGLTHDGAVGKGWQNRFLLYFYLLRLFEGDCTGATESVRGVTRWGIGGFWRRGGEFGVVERGGGMTRGGAWVEQGGGP